jgi:hypothetical protein
MAEVVVFIMMDLLTGMVPHPQVDLEDMVVVVVTAVVVVLGAVGIVETLNVKALVDMMTENRSGHGIR